MHLLVVNRAGAEEKEQSEAHKCRRHEIARSFGGGGFNPRRPLRRGEKRYEIELGARGFRWDGFAALCCRLGLVRGNRFGNRGGRGLADFSAGRFRWSDIRGHRRAARRTFLGIQLGGRVHGWCPENWGSPILSPTR